ncbi:MAG TPA: vWA domain-containing protein [Nitrospinota bacterium]|nr:vWA domain-containing protein [Nitrospinota bacterium]
MKFFRTRFLSQMRNIYFHPTIDKSMQYYKACFCTVFTFFLLCLIPTSSAEENVGDIIILFDQSASMKEYDPKSISKAWLITFMKTFNKPYNVLLVGFDERIHQHTKVSMKNKKDFQTLRDKIKRIEAHGLTTDMEAPFRYLLERDENHPIAFVVIVSDGEQEIWDEKRWYLSKRIRTDNRYEELNKQYRSLKAQGVTFKEIYNQLKTLYHARNLNLINERLAKLKEKIGRKLVFLDISGDFKFFEKWAEAMDAQYILANARGKEDPVEALRSAIIVLQERASDVLQEQLPSDYKERVEPIPEPQEEAEISLSGPSPEPELPAEPPAVSDKELPPLKSEVKETDKKEPLKEQLPPDHKESMESIPQPHVIEEPAPVAPSEPEPPLKPSAESFKESAALKTDLKETGKKDLPKRWMIFLTLFILLIVVFFSVVLFRYRKKANPTPE